MTALLSPEAVVAAPAGPACDPAGSHGPAPLVRHRIPVGLAAAALGALAIVTYPRVTEGVVVAFIAVILVVVCATDLERRVIPNRVVLPATAIVLVAQIALFSAHALQFVLASACAGAAFLLPNLINPSLMGMGDVKLAMFLGAGLGWGVIGAVVVAFLSQFPFAVAALVRGGLAARKATLPFGPFLGFGALAILMVPQLLGLGGS